MLISSYLLHRIHWNSEKAALPLWCFSASQHPQSDCGPKCQPPKQGWGRVGGRATAPCLAEVCVESQRLDLLLRWQHVLFPYKALTLTVWKPAAKQTDAAAMPGIQIFSLALLHVHSTYKLSERRHLTRASMQARCDVQQNIGVASLLLV